MRFKCLFLLLSVGQLAAYNTEYVTSIYDQLLKGHELTSKPEPVNPFVPKDIREFFKEALQSYESDFKVPAWQDLLNTLITEFPMNPLHIPHESVTDRSTLGELEIIRGSSTDALSMVRRLTAIDSEVSILSIAGQKRCAEMICMPVTTIKELIKRRDCIRALYQNSALLNEVVTLLKKIRETEPYVMDFFGKEGITTFERDFVYPALLTRILHLDDIPPVVTFGNRLNTLIGVGFVGLFSTATFALVGIAGGCSVAAILNALRGQGDAAVGLGSAAVACGCGTLLEGIVATVLYASLKSQINIVKHMQERVIGYATYMRSAHRLFTLMAKHPELVRLMPELKQQLRILQGDDQSSSGAFLDTNDLLMEASAFDEGEPSVFSSPGDILVVYKYLCDKTVRKEYAPIIDTVAAIDVYAVLAQQMRTHAQYENAPFCFVDFIENSNKPVLDIHNFWHPFIDTAHVVPNSIMLNQDRERNMLITGPNTGGKSTNMKAMALSVLLAQTFGIAPASSMRMTPFSAIITYLNVIDDTSAGLSLFKAEVKRVNELMEAVKNLPTGRFAFVMLDEIFTGTSPDKAEELSYKCLNKLNEFAHTIFICATHFKKLTGLEAATDGITKNYQVEAITDEHGMVTKYTYKIVPGISQISSAQQVAEETGLIFS